MEQQDKCPVNHSAIPLHQHQHAKTDAPSSSSSRDPSVQPSQNESCGGCPVPNTPTTPPPPSASGCPVKHKDIYNVYGEKINPTNQMPPPITSPWPGQKVTISVDRQTSNIPKGGTENTWVFPSPQMFYNALQRKNKSEGVTESDAETMVYVHNTMNENTWRQVLRWEKLHEQECADPRLHWFVGKPHDLSPKARLWSLFGGQTPFDRHDWVVDRCGTQVRYVIDFYSRDTTPSSSSGPAFPKSSLVADVRPALDSFGNGVDRLKMFFGNLFSSQSEEFVYKNPTPPPKLQQKIEDRDYKTEKRSLPIAIATTEKINERCQKYTEALLSCRNEREYELARSKVDLCIGRVVCPNEVNTFEEILPKATSEEVDRSYGRVIKCVGSFNVWLSESLALANQQQQQAPQTSQPPQPDQKKVVSASS
jgi:cytochrome c heme-lyase